MTFELLIPTYNRAALLQRCLDSVDRAVRPKELILTVTVIDNNSNDNTRQIAEQFIDKCSMRARYIFVGRPGKSAALNEVLAQTDSDFVGFIDDDEQLDRTWFEVAYREFANNPQLDYIGGPYLPDWQQEPPEWLPPAYPGAIGIVPRPHRLPFSREFAGVLMGGNAVVRRSVLERVLPYPEDLGNIGGKIRSGEDEVIYQRLLDAGAIGMVVPELVIYHWIPAQRLTKKYHRRWVIGRGISRGKQLRDAGFSEPGMFGIPRHQIGTAIRGLRLMWCGRSSQERFTAQLSILDCLATLYGRYFY